MVSRILAAFPLSLYDYHQSDTSERYSTGEGVCIGLLSDGGQQDDSWPSISNRRRVARGHQLFGTKRIRGWDWIPLRQAAAATGIRLPASGL